MGLIECPDCEGKVSDSAPACPHCGRPAPFEEPMTDDGSTASEETPMISIHASSGPEACEKMFSHMSPYFNDGWTLKKAACCVDGWKNEYHLEKEGVEKLFEFDLRQSMSMIDQNDPAGGHVFTIMSMSIRDASFLSMKKEAEKKLKKLDPELHGKKGGGCLGVLVMAVALVGGVVSFIFGAD